MENNEKGKKKGGIKVYIPLFAVIAIILVIGIFWYRQYARYIRTDDAYIDTDGLKEQMAQWQFPLHMIDFETSTVAIPFYRDLKPYEDVAFQKYCYELNATDSHLLFL